MQHYYEFLISEFRLFLKSLPILTGLYILTIIGVFLFGKILQIESITHQSTGQQLKAIGVVYMMIVIVRLWYIFYMAANNVRKFRSMKAGKDWGLWLEILIIGIPYTMAAFTLSCIWTLPYTNDSQPLAIPSFWWYIGLYLFLGMIIIVQSRKYVSSPHNKM